MRVSDLPQIDVERIKKMRYDQSLEKHEGPEEWASFLKYYPDMPLWEANGFHVLLPISTDEGEDPFEFVSLIRCIVSVDLQALTIFFKDTRFSEPKYEYFDAGRLAICEQPEGSDIYVATVFHSWFMVDNYAALVYTQKEQTS